MPKITNWLKEQVLVKFCECLHDQIHPVWLFADDILERVFMLDDKVACVLHQGLLLYQKTTRNSYLEKMDGPARASSNMDRFERCFSIFKLQKSAASCKSSSAASAEDVSTGRESEGPAEHHPEASGWRAVRVDLVVSPYSQFAFATLGWTGSKVCSFLSSTRSRGGLVLAENLLGFD